MGGISWFSSLKIKLERQGLRWLVVGLRGRELIGYKMMEMRLPGKGKRGRPERINICARDWRFVSTTVFSEQSWPPAVASRMRIYWFVHLQKNKQCESLLWNISRCSKMTSSWLESIYGYIWLLFAFAEDYSYILLFVCFCSESFHTEILRRSGLHVWLKGLHDKDTVRYFKLHFLEQSLQLHPLRHCPHIEKQIISFSRWSED